VKKEKEGKRGKLNTFSSPELLGEGGGLKTLKGKKKGELVFTFTLEEKKKKGRKKHRLTLYRTQKERGKKTNTPERERRGKGRARPYTLNPHTKEREKEKIVLLYFEERREHRIGRNGCCSSVLLDQGRGKGPKLYPSNREGGGRKQTLQYPQ